MPRRGTARIWCSVFRLRQEENRSEEVAHMRSNFSGGAGCGWRLGGRSEARISVAHRSGHGGGQTGCAPPFERGLPEKPAHDDRENRSEERRVGKEWRYRREMETWKNRQTEKKH